MSGVPGSWLGATVNARLDGNILLLIFSVLVLIAAHRMLTACPSCTRVGADEALAAEEAHQQAGTGTLVATRRAAPALRRIAPVLATGTLVGFLTGLFGVGGGFVIVPALTLALGLSMPAAIGTSLAVIVGNAAVALAFRGLDAVAWDLALPFTITMLLGSVAGAAVSHRLPPRRSLHAFASILVLVALANAAAALAGL